MTAASGAQTAEQVADHFAVSPSLIRRMACAGEIPCLRFGKKYSFLPEHVDAIRARFEVPATSVVRLPRRAS